MSRECLSNTFVIVGVDNDGQRVFFRHDSVNVIGTSSMSGAAGDELLLSNFDNDGVYAGFSPFTHWSLSFDPNNLLPLDFSSVSSIKIKLGGYAKA